jgi:diadenosine tetraphosphatase ApaH/serine/threonine PP2A family protein phosphatase
MTSDVFRALEDLVRSQLHVFVADPSTFSLPPIDKESAEAICSAAGLAFSADPVLLDLTGHFIVAGDVHGHVLDFLRIFATFGFPPATNYVFLGDLVDRGEFSVYIVLYAFAMKALFPGSFYLIRGNHECEDVNSIHGLLSEVIDLYHSDDLFHSINSVFALLPFAARLNGDFLCVHGGIGPGLVNLHQIESIDRPLKNCDDPIVVSLLWSDPNSEVEMQASPRGRGFEFGEAALTRFLEANKLKMLIRGHSEIVEGVLYAFDRKLVTVFSVSNYCDAKHGIAGVLKVAPDDTEPTAHFLIPTPYVGRKHARLSPLVPPKLRALRLSPSAQLAPSTPPIVVRMSRGRMRCSASMETLFA